MLTMVPLHVLSSSADTATFRVSPSTPVERLSQVRRRKKRTWDDRFNEILHANTASNREHRAWKINIADSLEKERVEKSKAYKSQQEKERKMNQDIMGLLRQQTHGMI
ncbi:unnamed protein product [Caretta caretta]